VIPNDDISLLKKEGISEVFGPGTALDEIIKYINDNVIKQ
jgi:methylmalonyl-CoA mutase cobalamin-binding domain/chain